MVTDKYHIDDTKLEPAIGRLASVDSHRSKEIDHPASPLLVLNSLGF
jgi:hypothetical protein